jgi:hypothetical protein
MSTSEQSIVNRLRESFFAFRRERSTQLPKAEDGKYKPGYIEGYSDGFYECYTGMMLIFGIEDAMCNPDESFTGKLNEAAPKLLDACEKYLDAMERYGHPDKTDRLMRQAIAMVRGESKSC